ncbi:hypothetical protein GCM10009532_10470 [Microbacterium aurantiacum]
MVLRPCSNVSIHTSPGSAGTPAARIDTADRLSGPDIDSSSGASFRAFVRGASGAVVTGAVGVGVGVGDAVGDDVGLSGGTGDWLGDAVSAGAGVSAGCGVADSPAGGEGIGESAGFGLGVAGDGDSSSASSTVLASAARAMPTPCPFSNPRRSTMIAIAATHDRRPPERGRAARFCAIIESPGRGAPRTSPEAGTMCASSQHLHM